MEFKEFSKIKGLIEITPRIFNDDRGFFFESFNEKTFKDKGLDIKFIQDNQSFSIKGVIRGLHFQKSPYGQGKLVRVISGKVLDVVVDIRKGSPTFGSWDSLILEGSRSNMIYVPEGFAHGFSALEDSVVLYKVTSLYNKQSEEGINWADSSLKIDWKVSSPIVSDKDKELKNLEELISLSSI
jgi:dTDP-4-dehydrorhamnose 3,5-epimerase